MRYLKPFSLPLGLLVAVLLLQLHVKSIRSEDVAGVYEAPSLDQFREVLNLQSMSDEPSEQDAPLISEKELLVQLTPLLASRSVENVAKFLKNDAISLPQRLVLLDEIISNMAYGFSVDDAVQLILDVANGYAAGTAEQDQIFSVLLKHENLLQKTSPLYIAIKNDYSHTYLPLVTWAIKNAATNEQAKKDLLELKKRALLHAVDLGDAEILEKIHKYTAQGITKDEATDLVWHIAITAKHPELLAKLKEYGADMNQARGKTTPLIEAVEREYQDVITKLIEQRVNLDAIADPEFGTALQRAIAKRDVAIEELLRRAGARE